MYIFFFYYFWIKYKFITLDSILSREFSKNVSRSSAESKATRSQARPDCKSSTSDTRLTIYIIFFLLFYRFLFNSTWHILLQMQNAHGSRFNTLHHRVQSIIIDSSFKKTLVNFLHNHFAKLKKKRFTVLGNEIFDLLIKLIFKYFIQ